MSQLGHSRRFDHAPATSGLPPSTDIVRVRRHVSTVPEGDLIRSPRRRAAATAGGTSRPRAFAVLTLMIKRNLVGCSTGRSAGLAPRNILSMYSAARTKTVFTSTPPRERSNGVLTRDAEADGEVVWSWRLDAGVKLWRHVGPTGLRQTLIRNDGDKRARSPGRARSKPLKPLRAGMPGVPVDLW